jgi:hypothetical protein
MPEQKPSERCCPFKQCFNIRQSGHPHQTAIKMSDFAESADLTPVANGGITYDMK